MDQLVIYGAESFLQHPDEALITFKESLLNKSVLQRLKTLKIDSIARHPKTIQIGRWGLYFGVLAGVLYLSFRSYNNRMDGLNNSTLVTVTDQELAEMIEHDYPSFEMYFLDQDPQLAQTMADVYREYLQDPVGFESALSPQH